MQIKIQHCRDRIAKATEAEAFWLDKWGYNDRAVGPTTIRDCDDLLPGYAYLRKVGDNATLYVFDGFPAEIFVIANTISDLAREYRLDCSLGPLYRFPPFPGSYRAHQLWLWLNMARDAATLKSISHYPATAQVTWDRVFAVAWQRGGCLAGPPEYAGENLRDQVLAVFGSPAGWGQ